MAVLVKMYNGCTGQTYNGCVGRTAGEEWQWVNSCFKVAGAALIIAGNYFYFELRAQAKAAAAAAADGGGDVTADSKKS